jgi:hypothetical protein
LGDANRRRRAPARSQGGSLQASHECTEGERGCVGEGEHTAAAVCEFDEGVNTWRMQVYEACGFGFTCVDGRCQPDD